MILRWFEGDYDQKVPPSSPPPELCPRTFWLGLLVFKIHNDGRASSPLPNDEHVSLSVSLSRVGVEAVFSRHLFSAVTLHISFPPPFAFCAIYGFKFPSATPPPKAGGCVLPRENSFDLFLKLLGPEFFAHRSFFRARWTAMPSRLTLSSVFGKHPPPALES